MPLRRNGNKVANSPRHRLPRRRRSRPCWPTTCDGLVAAGGGRPDPRRPFGSHDGRSFGGAVEGTEEPHRNRGDREAILRREFGRSC